MDDGAVPPPLWMYVTCDRETPVDRDTPRVDLMRCDLWFRRSSGSNGWHNEWTLYRTPGGRWFEVYDEHALETGYVFTKAYWLASRDAAEWFLENPDVESPDEIRRLIDILDATELPPDVELESSDHLAPPPPSAAPPLVEIESHEGGRIDFAAITSALRKDRKPMQAALIEYMADRSEATAEEVAEHVHKEFETNEKTMRANARKTSNSLEDMGIPVRFRLASGYMFRDISPE